MQKINLPNLRHINLALTILAGSSMRNAARICNMTQPAASLAINSLEDLFSVTFFERSPRGLVPTQYAEILNTRGKRASRLLMQSLYIACGEEATDKLITRKLIGLTTTQLIAIAAVRGARNLDAAAAELGMQPQSLRRTLLTLEGWLDSPILSCDESTTMLSEKGQKIGQLMALAVAEIIAIKTEIREIDRKVDGTVVIGSVRAAAAQLIPEVIIALNQRYPFGKFNIIRESYEVMLDALESAKIDYVCTALRPQKLSSGLTGEILASTQLRAMCSVNHPLAGRKITIEDLTKFPWIGPPKQTSSAAAFRERFEQEGIAPPEFTIETFSTEWTQELVMRSNYILLFRTTSAYHRHPTSGMVFLEDVSFSEHAPIWLIHRKDFRPTHFQSMFHETMKEICTEPLLIKTEEKIFD